MCCSKTGHNARTALILAAKQERFSDLEEVLCRSFVQSLADVGDLGYRAFTAFIAGNGKTNLLQKRELVKVADSLRNAARDLEEEEMIGFLERALLLAPHEVMNEK